MLQTLPEGTLLFGNNKVLRLKFNRSHNGEAYGYSDFFNDVDELFAANPKVKSAQVYQVRGGELVHGCGTYNRSGYANRHSLFAYRDQFRKQHGHDMFDTGYDKNFNLVSVEIG